MAELKLFRTWSSRFALRVVWALDLKGIQFDTIFEDLSNKSSLLLQYNPIYKKVPVLVHNGKPLAESLISLKQTPLLPEDPSERATARFWAKFGDDKVLPSVYNVFIKQGKDQEEAIVTAHENLRNLEGLISGKKWILGRGESSHMGRGESQAIVVHEALFRCLSCLRHCPAATVRNPVACTAKKLIHRLIDLLPPFVLPIPNSDNDTSAAVGKISRGSTQPRQNQPHRSLDAPPRAAQSSGAVTFGSPATGLRSRHLRRRSKDLGKHDPTAQESISSEARRAATRRPKIRPLQAFSATRPRACLLSTLCSLDCLRVCTDAASFDPVSLTTPTYSIADLQALFNSACCNHMTDNPHLTSAHTLPVLPTITTADGSAMTDSWTGQIVGIARKVGRLFELTSLHLSSSSVSAPVIVASASIELWHSRLGHVSLPCIQTLVSRGLLGSVSSSPFDCMPCQLGKQPALPFNNSESIASATFDLIHSDIWGPFPVPTTQYSKAIKVFHSDNAREYRQTDFFTILKHYGTIFHTSCVGTSQQNGRAERKLRHILDTVRALTNAASTPASFWGEAALTAVYTINRCPSPVVQNTTPYERLFGTAPNYSLLKVFGCVCFVLLQPHERTKLQPCSQLCCFLGYGLEEKGYRCYDPIAKRLRVSRHVVFWEHKMFYSLPLFSAGDSDSQADPLPNLFPEIPSPSAESVHPIFDESPPADPSSDESPTADPTFDESPLSAPAANPVNTTAPKPRRSHRVSTLPSHLRDFHCFSAFATLHEPHTFREASFDPLWQQAMKEELDALLKTGTWDLVDLPAGKSAIGCKWVYKIKTRSDGTVDRYKARLVAKGFTQEYGIDYEETFALVARLSSVRTLIAVSASRHWPLFQMDVKNAFLNGELTEEVYMQLPSGFSQPLGFSPKVCRLRRALYGLKQAPRAWFAKFSSTISQHGFSASSYDSALFFRCSDHGITLLLLYVDDIIITGDDVQGIQDLKRFLGQHFEMKDLGPLSYFLGLEVSSSSDGYYLTQAKYTSDLISRAGITDSKIVDTSIEYNNRLNTHDGEPLPDATLYRQLVGSLVYLTVTRPDISYAVHIVSQFMAAPRSLHYAAAYFDADWAGDPTDHRSTIGYCFLLGDSLISWRSKKQSVVACSSTEAEYRALADTTAELLWLRWLLQDLGIDCSTTVPIHCDNRSAIQIAHNDVFHERTKHIEIDCHFVRHHLLQGTLQLRSVSSQDQLADIFTKPMPPGRFRDLISKLKLVSLHPT
uniref:Integrase catalytic domain-containing protein n=1 Tax=Fagus sylvatica TaxID=28930 RepID=A0A2N9IYW1_FAGSY